MPRRVTACHRSVIILIARLVIAGWVGAPTLVYAQDPWTVALTPTMDPLPIGGCGRIDLTLVDPRSRDRGVPLNALRERVTIADFDITLTTPNGISAALLYRGEYHVEACGCQRAVPGTIATITATYPAVALDAKARVPGVAFQRTASFELSAPKGASNPEACERLASAPIRQRPSTLGSVERSAPRAAVPAPVAQTPIAPPAPRRTITASPINLVGTGFTGKVVRTITAPPIVLHGQ